MMDPALAELMESLTRPPPGVVREGPSASGSSFSAIAQSIAAAERDARAVEDEAEAWIRDVERGLGGFLSRLRERGIPKAVLEVLPGVIAGLEDFAAAETREFTRGLKRLRRERKHIAAECPWYLQAFDAQSKRVRHATSRRNLALAEFIFALRACYAEASGQAERGVVYHDPKSLGDALRAAIA